MANKAWDATNFTDGDVIPSTEMIKHSQEHNTLRNGELIIVKSDGTGDYTKLSSAFTAIVDASASKRYVIWVVGKVSDDTVITPKSHIDVRGIGGVVECTADIANAVNIYDKTDCRWDDLIIKSTGARTDTITTVLRIVHGDDTVVLNNITASNETTSSAGIGIEICKSPTILYECVAKGGGDTAYCALYVAGDATLINCKGIASDLSGSTGISVFSAAPNLISCIGESGLATGSLAYECVHGAAPIMDKCSTILKKAHNTHVYLAADSGRFRPFSGHPYQLIAMQIDVVNANIGVTLDIGTSVGGSQIASGIDIGSTGYKYFDFSKAEIAADGYIYLTPSAGITDGDVSIRYSVIYNYSGSTGVVLNTHGAAKLNNCSILANGASDAVVISGKSITYKNWEISNCVLETYDPDNQFAVSAGSAVTDAQIRSSTLIGGYNNIDFIDDAKSSHIDMFMDVLAASNTHVRNSEDLSAAIPITFTIDAQPDVPRMLRFAFNTHANITAYTIDFVGVDAKGNTITKTITEADGWGGGTNCAFATITSITMSARTGTGVGDTIEIGILDHLGLANDLSGTGDVYKIKKNNANATVAGAQVNTTSDLYDMTVIGLIATDDFSIWYKSNSNVVK